MNKKKTGSATVALRFLFSASGSLLFFLSVFFFPVTETYLGNPSDYSIPFGTLVSALLPIVFGGAVLVALSLSFLPERGRIAVTAILCLLGLVAWAQSALLNGRMLSMTGEREVYSAGLAVGNLALLVGLLAAGTAAVVICFRRGRERMVARAAVALSLLLLLMQGVGALFGALTTKEAQKDGRYLTSEGETTLSADHNVVVFLLDFTTGPYVTRARMNYPDLFDGLDGFTYYPDSLPVFTRTYPSVTYLLTGVPCRFDSPFSEYVDSAAKTGTFLPGTSDAGTSLGVYTGDYFVGSALRDLLENVSEEGAARRYLPLKIARYSFSLALKRVSPYLLKPAIRYDADDVNYRALAASSDAPSDEERFYARIREEGLSKNDAERSFRFFHFNGPHPGTRLRADGTYSDAPTGEDQALMGDFTIIRAYLAELKRLGIYDKTTVIVTTDHADSALSAPSGKLDVVRPSDILMMVKPAASVEGFSVSDAEISHDDLFATVYAGLGLDPSRYGVPIWSVPSGVRSRTLLYTALFSNSDGEIAQLEYEVRGDSRDLGNYRWTGRYRDVIYSYNAVSSVRFAPSLMEQTGE